MSSRTGAGRPDRRARLARLTADRELLAREYPYLQYRLDERQAIGVASGAMPMLLPDGRIDPIRITIDFHRGYLPGPPSVYDADRRWVPNDDRHIPQDHSFCLYLRDVDEPDLRSPAALGVFMLDVVCFLEQQLIYDRIGRFPGPQWPHRRDAYALYVLEALEREAPASRTQLWEATRGSQPTRNDPCACGGAAKYKRCHLDLISELAAIASRHHLLQLDYAALEELARAAA